MGIVVIFSQENTNDTKTDRITIQVTAEAARAYRAASKDERRTIDSLLNRRLRSATRLQVSPKMYFDEIGRLEPTRFGGRIITLLTNRDYLCHEHVEHTPKNSETEPLNWVEMGTSLRNWLRRLNQRSRPSAID